MTLKPKIGILRHSKKNPYEVTYMIVYRDTISVMAEDEEKACEFVERLQEKGILELKKYELIIDDVKEKMESKHKSAQ